MKGVMRFGKKGKLSPRYVGPYRILKRIAFIVPLETVAVKDSLSYEDAPIEILDRQVRRLRNKEVTSVKVWWISQSVEGATWEAKAVMKAKYPHLFRSNFTPALGQTKACDGGPWFTTATLSQTQLRKSAKSRPTDIPMIRRSDHDPWSVSVDQDCFTSL
ncbi:hypothetical protein MTR67_039076 [Solanum verrucosum]|uniref:Uncharacterized protein n=1 Tax=Solanum verrucosum TaxID=315347 RepID=A0AAF0ZNH1_SOLVR|nr:hypothetical protein MTR67_039076 [Solanum verrucosum]